MKKLLLRSYSLREKPNSPEEITIDNLDDTLDFLLNEDYLENFYREKVRKEQLLETTQKEKVDLELALKKYKDKEESERQQAELIKYNQRKEHFTNESWNSHKSSNNKDLLLLFGITILTFGLIAIPFFIGLSKELKEWFIKFEGMQILVICIYLFLATLDILGSRYLYKKDKISNGWNWFINLFSYSNYKMSKIEQFNNEYSE